jgi:hypothetical protein
MSRLKILAILLLLLLAVSLSFGLGYLLARESNRAPIIIKKCSE